MRREAWIGLGVAFGAVIAVGVARNKPTKTGRGGRAAVTAVAPTTPTPRVGVARERTTVDRPNFLLMIADDLGQDQVGAYGVGVKPPPTPRLDRLADEGLLFRNAVANPVCSPTRGTVMTGRYAHRYGIGNAIPPRKGWGLPESEVVIARTLRERAAYESAMIGKWHLATPDMGGMDHVRQVGFTHHLGTMGNLNAPVIGSEVPQTYFTWSKFTDGEVSTSTDYVTAVSVDDALRMAAELPEPWLIIVGFHLTHFPMHLPPKGLFTQNVPSSPSEGDLYRLMVEALDTEVGRLLDGLPAERRARTDILFMGDNGTAPVGVYGASPKQQSKGALTNGGIAVPFIWAGPSVAVQGGETVALVNTSDLFATWLDLAHADGTRPEDSVSFAPVLADPSAHPRRYAFAERFSPNGMGPWEEHVVAIRDERYKLILSNGKPEAMYDLQEDPGEARSLFVAGQEPTPEQLAAFKRLKFALPAGVQVVDRPTPEAMAADGLDVSGRL